MEAGQLDILLARRRSIAIQLRSIADRVDRGEFPQAEEFGLILLGAGVPGWMYATNDKLASIMKAMAARHIITKREP